MAMNKRAVIENAISAIDQLKAVAKTAVEENERLKVAADAVRAGVAHHTAFWDVVESLTDEAKMDAVRREVDKRASDEMSLIEFSSSPWMSGSGFDLNTFIKFRM